MPTYKAKIKLGATTAVVTLKAASEANAKKRLNKLVSLSQVKSIRKVRRK